MSEMNAPRLRKLAKEPLLTSFQRADPVNRFWAKAIDFTLIETMTFAIGFFFPRLSLIFIFLAWGTVDRFGRGQSPGKWLLGLQTIEGKLGGISTFSQGLMRNVPILLVSLALSSPPLLRWICLPVGLGWVGIEIYFTFALRTGMRVGDIFANTRVLDYKDEHTQFIEQFLKEREAP